MYRLKKIRSQRGDTIMEVLIAVAVLSLVMTLAFTLANNSTQGTRQSQERGEAFKHTESQIELLKTYISQTATPSLPADGSKFCIKNDGTPSNTFAVAPNAQNETFAGFNDPALVDCKKGDFYYNYIERQGNTYTAHTRWTKVGGRGIDESTMVHRIYPDLASTGANSGTVNGGCPVGPPYTAYVISLGTCTPCPVGYSSLGGFDGNCLPIKPQIRIVVQKVPPGPGNTPPGCDAATSAGGIPVRVDGAGGPYTGNSNDSLEVLGFSSPYVTSINTPAGFVSCSPPTQTVNTTSLGTKPPDNIVTATFKIRPLCPVETRIGPAYDHYTAPYAHYTAPYAHYSPVYWWEHPGPDARRAGWPRFTFQLFEGSTYVEYRYRGDLGGVNPFHERWTYTGYNAGYLGTYGDYIGTYGDYLGRYGDPYNVNVCAS